MGITRTRLLAGGAVALFLAFGLTMQSFAQESARPSNSNSESTVKSRPIVIAHRGASGYLPEHTEGAKVLAVAQGADFIEQDVVMTRDKQFVVCHDITLQDTTNVAERFPDRGRGGVFHVTDFTWDELQQLSVNERQNRHHQQVYPRRFPGGFHQRLMRLEDELKLLRGLSQTLSRKIGIYVELKRPDWHQQELKVDMAAELISLLSTHGYEDATSACFIQCFDHTVLEHLRRDLKCRLPLIALMGGSVNEKVLSEQMKSLAAYATGIGPSLEMLAQRNGEEIVSTGLVEAARTHGLLVHPYTVRNDDFPRWCRSQQELYQVLLGKLKVDGFFTDFPETSVAAVRSARW